MFVNETDLVEIKIYFIKMKHRYLAYTETEFKKLDLKEDEKKKYKSLSIKMKELTWGLYNQLQEDAMVEDINGNSQFNVKIYKENRLNKLLVEWDAVDKDGKQVPVAPAAIVSLAADIAETILRAYDEFSFIDKDEEGK